MSKDAIYRQEAIDAIERTDWYHQNSNGEMVLGANSSVHQPWYKADEILAVIENLPSAPPERKTGRWIPVTERLPKVDEYVLVSYHFDGDSEFFPQFDGVTISYWTGVKNHNIPHFADIGDACTVLAWMPLPEAYKGGNDGKTD